MLFISVAEPIVLDITADRSTESGVRFDDVGWQEHLKYHFLKVDNFSHSVLILF